MIGYGTHLRPSRRPIFMENLCLFWGMTADPSDHLYLLCYFSRLGNKWLNEVKVKESAANLRYALVLYRLLNRYAAFELLQPPLGGLTETVQFYKRLKGLIDPEERLAFGHKRSFWVRSPQLSAALARNRRKRYLHE